MNPVLAALLAILSLIIGIYFIYYIWTLPERREQKERLRRELLLYEEKCKAEQAKQNARVAGETVRREISKIASQK